MGLASTNSPSPPAAKKTGEPSTFNINDPETRTKIHNLLANKEELKALEPLLTPIERAILQLIAEALEEGKGAGENG